jgi:c-di-GMP-binding flagellar brake protein YcgR
MTKKARAKSSSKKNLLPVDDSLHNRRREWRMDLPLAAIVEGKLPRGSKFREPTRLENISSGGAYFCLDSGIVVGSKLNLVIDLPKKMTKGKWIKLLVGGITIRLEDVGEKDTRQGVAVRFFKRHKFLPPPTPSSPLKRTKA